MSIEVSPSVYARALKVAQSLKLGLETRLIGETADVCGTGPSMVVAINIPSDEEQIAMWSLWTCQMIRHDDKTWALAISNYIPWQELYTMFRNAFAGIPVKVDHPHSVFWYDKGQVSSEERKFNGSGRKVQIRTGQQAYVRPVGDLSKFPWLNAGLRIDANLECYPTKEPMICCNIDPFEYEQRSSRGEGIYVTLPDPSDRLTFYVGIPPGAGGKYLYLPIARVVDVNKATGETTFELDQSVESMDTATEAS